MIATLKLYVEPENGEPDVRYVRDIFASEDEVIAFVTTAFSAQSVAKHFGFRSLRVLGLTVDGKGAYIDRQGRLMQSS